MHAFFFFNDTATTEIYTLSLHDALPICLATTISSPAFGSIEFTPWLIDFVRRNNIDILIPNIDSATVRSEEHTSELQSPCNLVCRLLLEKKNTAHNRPHPVIVRDCRDST